MQNRTNRIVTNWYYYLLLLLLLLIFSFSFCLVIVVVCFAFVLVCCLLFCCRYVFTPVPADVTITRGATVEAKRRRHKFSLRRL